ncbi:MAG: ISAs1 family transposase [Bacteriovoracaceae bacterium]|nr:ISAs1 family transposase [Bacteriovoracaceae bacterium]
MSSANEDAKYFLMSTKLHWEVENKLHWQLDVTFKEDDCRCNIGYSAQNFAMLRQFALNLIKQEPTKNQYKENKKLQAGLKSIY